MGKYFTYIIVVVLACMSELAFAQDKSPQQIEKNEEVKEGLSMGKPIVCKDIKDLEQVEQFIRKYIKENYPDYKVIATISDEDSNERSIEVWVLKKENDENVEYVRLHFDIEDAMIEFRKKNKKLIDELVKDIHLIYE